MKTQRIVLCIAAAFAAILTALPLQAQIGGHRPISTVRTIDAPGNYFLIQDVSFGGGAAITITASGVTLDLNGHQLLGPGGVQGTGVLIQGATGVKVHDGYIADTAFGVVVDHSNNVTLTGLQIRGQGLAVTAPPPEVGVMIVESKNVVVERNSIYNTGLGAFVRGGQSGGNRISNNTITAGTNGGLGICYNPAPGDSAGPQGDLVYNNLVSGFNTGISVVATANANVFRENTIAFRTAAFVSTNASNLDINNIEAQLP